QESDDKASVFRDNNKEVVKSYQAFLKFGSVFANVIPHMSENSVYEKVSEVVKNKLWIYEAAIRMNLHGIASIALNEWQTKISAKISTQLFGNKNPQRDQFVELEKMRTVFNEIYQKLILPKLQNNKEFMLDFQKSLSRNEDMNNYVESLFKD